MIETILEIVKVILAFIGFCVYAHYLAFAISWGWWKGRAKVKHEILNYHINK